MASTTSNIEVTAVPTMRVSIEYCMEWNYQPRAFSLRDELHNQFGIQSELIQSSGGVFEIELNENLIFSKKKSGRFPNDGEVASFIEGIENVI